MEGAESSERQGGHLDCLLISQTCHSVAPTQSSVCTWCVAGWKEHCGHPWPSSPSALHGWACVTMPTPKAEQDKSGNLTKVR